MLRSLEEFLYETIALLYFLPVTIWRILRRPVETMRYAEQDDSRQDQVQ